MGSEPIGQEIKQWRMNLGMTQAEACRASGIHPDVWSRAESGKSIKLPFDTVAKMFAGMGAELEVKMIPRTAQPDPATAPQLPLPTRRPDPRLHADA